MIICDNNFNYNLSRNSFKCNLLLYLCFSSCGRASQGATHSISIMLGCVSQSTLSELLHSIHLFSMLLLCT